ncbi:hypothetical protein A9Q61_13065 [Yersinia ruckeri]|uniref:hypothetical protein n=1 Tax=Yersinia ruckeri TaxID=29486 RepID=UPI00091EFCA0|nr:hypothetical protein [Yersinia ruckeri]OJB80744.1 hypothetical protein A9Q61_13065 [Yersinia ruckeri]OJB88929.1 hypothetical protein A9Q59_12775 [Yersinia ruckeri]
MANLPSIDTVKGRYSTQTLRQASPPLILVQTANSTIYNDATHDRPIALPIGNDTKHASILAKGNKVRLVL